MPNVETLPLQLRLKDIATLTAIPMSTLYHHWQSMVLDGRLPSPLKGYNRPRWPRDATLAMLCGNPAHPDDQAHDAPAHDAPAPDAPAVTSSHSRKPRHSAAADALAGLMAANR